MKEKFLQNRMGDDERFFEISNQHAHLFNGHALELKDPYLSLLRNKLGTRQYSVDVDGARNDSFWILHDDQRVAHMFLGRGQGVPDQLAIMAVPHFEEHLDAITSLVQDWLNNTPAQGGSRRRRRATRRKSKKSKQSKRKH